MLKLKLKIITKLIAVLACGLSLGSVVHAENEEDISTQLSVLTFYPNSVHRELFWGASDVKSSQAKLSVTLSSSCVLPPVKYEGPRTLKLGVPVVEDHGKAVLEVLAQVKLPVSKQVLVVLLPNPKGSKLLYNAIALDADVTKLAPGSRLFVNLTKVPVRGVIGPVPFNSKSKVNKKYIVKPRQTSAVAAIRESKTNRGYQVVMEFQNPKAKSWHRMLTKRWFNDPKLRKFVFVYANPSSKVPAVRVVVDTPEFEE